MTESVLICPTPIPKSGEPPLNENLVDFGMGEKENQKKNYLRHLPLYFGSLVTYILEGKEEPMSGFIAYLNSLSAGFGDAVCRKLKETRQEFEKNFSGRNITWFTEVSFTPSLTQIEKIKTILDGSEIETIADYNEYKDVGLFIRDILLGKIDKIKIDNENVLAKDLFSEATLGSCSKKEPFVSKDKLTELLRYIISYYYFDFVGTKEPPNLSQIIASTSARIDMLGLEPAKNEKGVVDETAKNLIEEIKNKGVLNHFMLDLTSLTAEERSLIRTLLEYIANGKVKFVFIEIKSQLTDTDLQGRRVVFQPENALPQQYQDVAHSLLAMFQFLTRATNLPGGEKIEGFGDLIGLMSPDIEERRKALFSLRRFIKSFRPPKTKQEKLEDQKTPMTQNEFYLVKVFWPILNRKILKIKDEEEISLFMPNDEGLNKLQIAVIKLSYREVMKSMVKRAREAIASLTQQKTQ